MKLIFAGTPEFAVPSLALSLERGYKPSLVLTQPDRPAGRGQALQPPPVKRVALESGLPVAQPERLADMRSQLEALSPDVMVVVAYAHKIPSWLLELPPWGCLNVHPSLLPRYRGASPVAAALLNGDHEAGVSIMRLDDGWDTGPVLGRRAVPVRPDDTAGTLTDRLAMVGAELLTQVLAQLQTGTAAAFPQDESQATYAPKLTREQGRLQWSKPAQELAREVRAYSPWPGSYTFWNGKLLKVLGAEAMGSEELGVKSEGRERPFGRVLPGLRVTTGGGLLALNTVQLEG
ncbi:MAG: methionyl-tRNA formyltransferase, partial [Chloroflexota bacterium]|nr:methionyl-tRNA formyltransferase [Chloroflexota bacterium]